MKKYFLILVLSILLNANAQTNKTFNMPSPDEIEKEMEKFYSKLTPQQISSLKEEVDNNSEKGTPNLLPNVFVKILNLPRCNEALKEKIESCIKYSCYEEHTGIVAKYISQVIVNGFNSSKNCSIAYNNQKLFVPSNDLKAFYELKTVNQTLGSSFGGQGTKVTANFKFKDVECTVESSYKNILKTDHLIEVRPSEISKYVLTATTNGKTYAAKDGGAVIFDLDLKLVDFKITKGPLKKCKSKRVTLFQELQKKGDLVILDPPQYKHLPLPR